MKLIDLRRFGACGLLLLSLLFASCDSGGSPTEPVGDPVFVIRACGETFRVAISNPRVSAEARSLIGRGHVRILSGDVARGHGGFNPPWSWHLSPASIAFFDTTREQCDGCPGYVERNLDAWIREVGDYCPWTSEVVAQER